MADWLKAAQNYERANNPTKSLKLFQKIGDEAIPQMIELIGKNKGQQSLIQNLIDYLYGEFGDGPKDPKWLLELYYSIGNISVIFILFYFIL